MKICELIETKLADEESLNDQETHHLSECPHCQACSARNTRIKQTIQHLAPSWDPTQAEVERVTQHLAQQTLAGFGLRRLIQAGVALFILIGALVVTSRMMRADQSRPPNEQSIFQLLDEIDDIAHSSVGETQDFWSLEQDAGVDLEEFDIPLPGGYQLLNDVLDERYL